MIHFVNLQSSLLFRKKTLAEKYNTYSEETSYFQEYGVIQSFRKRDR